MTIDIQQIAPDKIEGESFRIITNELGPHNFDPKTYKVVQRTIHATGDFSFAENIRLHPRAISRAMEVIKNGWDILTDVNMVASGISKNILKLWGGKVHCLVADPGVAATAVSQGKTRSEIAMEQGLSENNIGIIAIGNAPTALLRAMQCVEKMEPDNRPLIVGVPVGFVNAAESKAILAEKDYPFITSLGRKGGSPVAAAMVNALLRMAK